MPEDLASVMDLWLHTSKEAHGFISEDHWEGLCTVMEKEYFGEKECLVYEKEGEVVGFILMDDDGSILSIFIQGSYQRQGIGTALINHVKEHNDKLFVSVYQKNGPGGRFFIKNGFVKQYEQIDKNTNEAENFFQWHK